MLAQLLRRLAANHMPQQIINIRTRQSVLRRNFSRQAVGRCLQTAAFTFAQLANVHKTAGTSILMLNPVKNIYGLLIILRFNQQIKLLAVQIALYRSTPLLLPVSNLQNIGKNIHRRLSTQLVAQAGLQRKNLRRIILNISLQLLQTSRSLPLPLHTLVSLILQTRLTLLYQLHKPVAALFRHQKLACISSKNARRASRQPAIGQLCLLRSLLQLTLGTMHERLAQTLHIYYLCAYIIYTLIQLIQLTLALPLNIITLFQQTLLLLIALLRQQSILQAFNISFHLLQLIIISLLILSQGAQAALIALQLCFLIIKLLRQLVSFSIISQEILQLPFAYSLLLGLKAHCNLL